LVSNGQTIKEQRLKLLNLALAELLTLKRFLKKEWLLRANNWQTLENWVCTYELRWFVIC